MTASITPFTDWFNAQGFRHFAASEFESYFMAQRRGVTNSAPPQRIWKNIMPTLLIGDDLRESFGKTSTILNSYRSFDYNKAVGGVGLSHNYKRPGTISTPSEAGGRA